MRILIDIGHPAHVHFFRHPIKKWRDHGHQVFITVRPKSNVTELLDHYGLEYTLSSKESRGGLLSHAITFITHTFNLLSKAIKSKANVILSISSPMAAWASLLSGIPHIAFDDTEHARLEHALYVPWTKRIYTPINFNKDLGPKQVRYAGFHELAYLHPNVFSSDKAVLSSLGIKDNEIFFVLRTVAWKAAHDLGHRGFSPQGVQDLIALLSEHGRVVYSSEAEGSTYVLDNGARLPASKMHDLLHYATLYIGEGGTMATEAALLGVPAVFVNTLSAGNWQELEGRYGLMFSFQDAEAATAKIRGLLANPNLKTEWQTKRARLLQDKIDVSEYVVDEVERFLAGSG